MTTYHLPRSAPPSKRTRAKRPVVSPEFVLFLPYPTANEAVSLAFVSIRPEYATVGLAPCALRNAGSPPETPRSASKRHMPLCSTCTSVVDRKWTHAH